jgi:hypothetical protein
MVEQDAFEATVEQLFDEPMAFADSQAFGDAVAGRVARVRQAGRLVHGVAWTLGGSIAALQLAQPSLWEWLIGAARQASSAVTQTVGGASVMWSTPSPALFGLILGGALLIGYVTVLLRET